MVGLDCFTDYYPRSVKESNLKELRRDPRFRFRGGGPGGGGPWRPW